MKNKKQKFFNFILSEDKKSADIYIFGDITSWEWLDNDVSSNSFQKELEGIGQVDTLNIHINSCGGDVFEGIAIYNLIKNYKAKKNVYIDGIAASIASVIAMAGDNIYMSNTSIMMIHNCWTWASGNAEDLRKTADDMDKVMQAIRNAYLSKINITEDKLKQLLDDESYMLADECLDMGFCSEIIENNEEEDSLAASNKSFYNLVIKIRGLEKQLSKKEGSEQNDSNHNLLLKLSEDQMNEIVEKVIERMKNSNDDSEDEKKQEKNKKRDLNEGSIMSLFLNKYLKNF